MMEHLIETHYGLRVQGLARVNEGVGGDVYTVETHTGRFVLKGTRHGDERACNEPRLVAFAARQGIPVQECLPTKDGEDFFHRGGKQYNLRPWADGAVYSYNKAPAWLVTEAARMQGKINAALAGFESLPQGIGPDSLAYLRSDAPRESYGKTLALAKKAGDASVVEDIRFRISQLHMLQEKTYDFSRFTIGNAHGDYKIQNLVCGEGRIAAVIDWTSACTLPLCLEIIRAYAHAAPVFSLEGLRAYTDEYQRYAPLNDYDLRMMPYFFRDLLLASDYYGQYYASKHSNRADYLAQAKFATRMLRELIEHS